MRKRLFKKILNKSFFEYKYSGKKCYTYRGVDDNGVYICLGVTAKPKQKYCVGYSSNYIDELKFFHGKYAYEMLNVFNYKYDLKFKK